MSGIIASPRPRWPDRFGCGHPRSPENTYTSPATGYGTCSLCRRVRTICYAVLRDQGRINAGERVGSGIRRSASRYLNG